MQIPEKQSYQIESIQRYSLILSIAWTLLVCSSFAWYWYHADQEIRKTALAQARASYEKDLIYRRWGAKHGGVYVPVNEQTPPNPHLSHIPERDIATPSGKQLTLVNPAYMTRQVYEMAREEERLGRGHITSLKPLRQENAPDPWEAAALKAFEQGEDEVSATVTLDGIPHIRLMRPFITEPPCLKCHAGQGYKLGDIRGGLSVSAPMGALMHDLQVSLLGGGAFHGIILLGGLAIVRIGGHKLCDNARRQYKSELDLHEQTLQLEAEIGERQQIQEHLQEQTAILEEEIAERTAMQEELNQQQQLLEEVNQSLHTMVEEAIAEMRRKDETLIHQGRLAAMGEMINNIAHQWRQPLNNVALIIQNMQAGYQSGDITPQSMERDVATAMGVIQHMSRTIDDFRNFFRQDKEKRPFIVNKVIALCLEFVSATLENCGIEVDMTAEDSVVATGYPNEYAQVILNILGNARDIMQERGTKAPRITIRLFSENGRSVVTIGDNGGGIAEEALPRIFDPYFTTREPGKGTGIGLYMSKTIIEKNMSGSLTARTVDGGAEFRIEV